MKPRFLLIALIVIIAGVAIYLGVAPDSQDERPAWVEDPGAAAELHPDYITAVGVGRSGNMQMALQKAQMSARAELVRQQQVEVSQTEEGGTTTTRTTSSGTLTGTLTLEQHIEQEEGRFVAYCLMGQKKAAPDDASGRSVDGE